MELTLPFSLTISSSLVADAGLDGVLAPDEQQGGGPGLRGRRLRLDLEDRRPLPGRREPSRSGRPSTWPCAAVFLQFYECWDFAVYCQTGRAVVQGTDPYASSLSQYPLNALPLFGLFALLPIREASGPLVRLQSSSPWCWPCV